VYAAWAAATAYIASLGILVFRRFRAGRWRTLRVIEGHVPELDPAVASA